MSRIAKIGSAVLQWDDKDPSEVLDYVADFSDAIPADDLIASVVWTISPVTVPPLVKSQESFENGTKMVTVWLSGGLLNSDYTITCKVTTDSAPTARVVERDIGVNVRNLI